MKLAELRQRRLDTLGALASLIESHRASVVNILARVESFVTATDEVEETCRALRTYASELGALEGREPFGSVAVALPFNTPLYSLVIYSCGAALGGSDVRVRPSSINRQELEDLFRLLSPLLNEAGIFLDNRSGSEFLAWVRKDPVVQSLIFTGSYPNLVKISEEFPKGKRLVYCGSGMNPFVVGPRFSYDQAETDPVGLAIDSRLYDSGQDCLCPDRFYVHESRFDGFMTELVERVASVTCGAFGEANHRITPLVPPVAANARRLIDQASTEGTAWHTSAILDDLIGPHVYEVRRDSATLAGEKFAPIFTVARYESDHELSTALQSDYRLGLTYVGAVDVPELSLYPHVTRDQTVIEYAYENAHAPFGGAGKSGFSRRGNVKREGPMLYSIETTTGNPA